MHQNHARTLRSDFLKTAFFNKVLLCTEPFSCKIGARTCMFDFRSEVGTGSNEHCLFGDFLTKRTISSTDNVLKKASLSVPLDSLLHSMLVFESGNDLLIFSILDLKNLAKLLESYFSAIWLGYGWAVGLRAILFTIRYRSF